MIGSQGPRLVFGLALFASMSSFAVPEGRNFSPGDSQAQEVRDGLDTIAGFEIGNGRRMVRNFVGNYSFKIPDSWFADIHGSLTQIVAPAVEGLPRTWVKVFVTTPEALSDESYTRTGASNIGSWIPIELGRLAGIRREKTFQHDREVEIRLFRSDAETMVILLRGARAHSRTFRSAYDSLSGTRF